MRRKLLLIGLGVLAVAATAWLTTPSAEQERDLHASEQFRAQAKETFDAIQRCDDYRTKPGIYYEPRLLEAKKALDSLDRAAQGSAEANINRILFNYLLAVERTRIDWECYSAAKGKRLKRDEDIKAQAYSEAMNAL